MIPMNLVTIYQATKEEEEEEGEIEEKNSNCTNAKLDRISSTKQDCPGKAKIGNLSKNETE